MTTPLNPQIQVVETPAKLGVCNCCGLEDEETRSVKHVQFHWRERAALKPSGPLLAGGTAVALCRECRKQAAVALINSL